LGSISDIKRAIAQSGKHPISAVVNATDPVHLTADVIFEGEQVIREDVPIRVFNDEDASLGVGWIPKVGSEVLIAFIDGEENRPQIIKVQQWDYLIARKGAGDSLFELIVDNENNVSLKHGSIYDLSILNNGQIAITTQTDIQVNCNNVKLSASGNIDLGDGGSGVVTNRSMPVCFVSGATIPCSQTVKAKL
jgi:phage gp45-like